MKYLILLLLSVLLWASPVSAAVPTLSSYSDFERTVACDDFVTNTAFMGANSFIKNKVYRVIFYDGAGDNVSQQDLTGATLNANKTLQHLFVIEDAPGTWHCVAYLDGYQPASYDPSDSNIVAECAFTVQEGAVPEIPDVVAGLAVAGIIGFIYWRLRKCG